MDMVKIDMGEGQTCNFEAFSGIKPEREQPKQKDILQNVMGLING